MISAFLIGLLGSLHCVGMCGPVMLTFTGFQNGSGSLLLYHTGRILSYMLMGLLLGTFGSFFSFLKIQQVTVLLLGVGIIFLYGIPRIRNNLEKFYYQSRFYKWIRSIISKNLSTKQRWFFGGVANGFFPCGLTYVAAAGAIVISNFWLGGVYMLLFGLGTIPALFAIQFSGSFFVNKIKALIPKSMYVVALLSGGAMIYRGIAMSFPDFE